MTRCVGEGTTVADEVAALVRRPIRASHPRQANPARDSHRGCVLGRPGHAPDGEEER